MKQTLLMRLRLHAIAFLRWLDFNPYEFENPKWMTWARSIVLWILGMALMLAIAFCCWLVKELALAVWDSIF